jgi:predicted metal-dependent hydrolase
MSTPPEPRLDDEERRQFDRGVDEFNRGFYFECHDTIEDLWSGLRGPSRDFFQGLIQVSVAYYHLGNGNLAGTGSMMRRALKRFERYPDRYFGFDLAAQRADLRRWLERIARGETAAPGEPAPRWRFEAQDADSVEGKHTG